LSIIAELDAREILDSRGRPTIAVGMRVDGTDWVDASVPSGASTGRAEACELRDGDPVRYGGLGCRQAVANVLGPIAARLVGKSFADQAALDGALLALDGTPNKSRLGANAILGVSLAFARATAAAAGLPLYRHLTTLLPGVKAALPRLTINLFSGGKHAGGQVSVQDLLLVPMHSTIDESLAATFATYYAAAENFRTKYGSRPLKADEGGLAPDFASVEAMFEDAVAGIRAAGFAPGRDLCLAVDVASSHFFRDDRYSVDGDALAAPAMIERIRGWVDRWPIVSVEDGLAEDDWEHWPHLCRAIAPQAITLGDDFLCTNPERIRRASDAVACNALLLKVNQIGTLTEAARAASLARAAGWKVVVSARSGETEDNWLADLAVGWAGDYIKVGSICQSERLAKYNRLLEIERSLGAEAAIGQPIEES